MVARFAETLFIGGAAYELDTAVDQLTLLWANALGLKQNQRPRKKPAAARA
jgi:hypothetical protein